MQFNRRDTLKKIMVAGAPVTILEHVREIIYRCRKVFHQGLSLKKSGLEHCESMRLLVLAVVFCVSITHTQILSSVIKFSINNLELL